MKTLSTHLLRLSAPLALGLLCWRFILSVFFPLADKTEARYAEIARISLEYGQWIMPHLSEHEPFMAKPPLSTWLSAGSMAIFGVAPWAARLPSLLLSVVMVWMVWQFMAKQLRHLTVSQRWLIVAALAVCPLFFVQAATVMTDTVHTCLVMAAMFISQRLLQSDYPGARSLTEIKKLQWLFWACIGCGMLAKGLGTVALIVIPLALFALITRQIIYCLRLIIAPLPILVLMCIPLIWHVLAERDFPGFNQYYFIGEHFSRFTDPGWKGDRYGIAQNRPRGTIWLFWIGAILPFISVFLTSLWKVFRDKTFLAQPLNIFFWSWCLAPLLFFTFSRNIIITYPLTAVIPFIVLCAIHLNQNLISTQRMVFHTWIGAVLLFVFGVVILNRQVNINAADQVVRVMNEKSLNFSEVCVTFKPLYSLNFYSRSEIKKSPQYSLMDVNNHFSCKWLLIETNDVAQVQKQNHLNWLNSYSDKNYTLMQRYNNGK
jgi:4-amino-4-deoxy-L-arabinose transferase-like glycosyltransferase